MLYREKSFTQVVPSVWIPQRGVSTHATAVEVQQLFHETPLSKWSIYYAQPTNVMEKN